MRHLRFLSGAAVIAAALTAGPDAQAGHGSWGASYGSSGGAASYGSSGGSSGGFVSAGYGSSGGFASAGGSTGGFGSSGGDVGRRHGGLLHRLFHHRGGKGRHGGGWGSSGGFASHGSHGSSGGGLASYGSSGGFASHGSSGGLGSYGSSGGAVAIYKKAYVAPVVTHFGGSSGGSSGGAIYSAPSYHYQAPMMPQDGGMQQPPQPQPPQQQQDPDTVGIGNDSVLMTVSVPESAAVYVNGLATTSTGPIRQFMSKGLKEGYVYKYDVEVVFAGGQEPQRRTLKLRAGTSERLVFSAPQVGQIAETKPAELETVVTLRVPANATVELAGHQTKGEGEVRTFRSTRLAEGQRWEDYTIRVTANVNGSVVSKERTLDLVAGSAHDLSFDFDAAQVASR